MHDEGSFQNEPSRRKLPPRKTVTGRIVYNRRLHRFTIRDWARIGEKVPPPENLQEAFRTVGIIYDAWNKIVDYLFGWMPGYRIARLIVDREKEALRAGLWELQRWIPSDSKLNENIDKILGLLDGI